jgi:invasion protein IalB
MKKIIVDKKTQNTIFTAVIIRKESDPPFRFLTIYIPFYFPLRGLVGVNIGGKRLVSLLQARNNPNSHK